MKKSGFTLAEVLITLGIIGVVAALTAPVLVSSFQKNKVGPTLKRFVSNMAEANTQLLYDNEVATVTSFVGSDVTVYLDELGKYLKGSRDTTTVKSEESSGDEEGKGTTRDLSDYNVYFADGETDSLSGPIFLFEDGSTMAITEYTGSVVDFENTSKGSYKGCIARIVFAASESCDN